MTSRVLVFVLALLAVPARAESFDCAKAATKIEKAICADPALGKLDADVAAAYDTLAAGLDDPMRKRLQRSQREWLRSRPAAPAPALRAQMATRIRLLQAAKTTKGPVAFLKLADDSRPMYVLDAVPGAAAYNAWVDTIWVAGATDQTLAQAEAEQARCEAESGGDAKGDCVTESTTRTYETMVPGRCLVSVRERLSRYQQGAAHPENETHLHNWWLSRSGRVTAADMFVGAGYEKVIAHAVRAFVARERQPGDVTQGAIDDVSTPDSWGLGADALQLAADGYSLELGRGEFQIDVPWRDFGAGLNPVFAAALKAR